MDWRALPWAEHKPVALSVTSPCAVIDNFFEESDTMQIRKIKRHGDRAVPDEAPEILAQGLVAHVGVVQDGQPVIIPQLYHYDPAVPDVLYLHGAPANGAMATIAGGAPVCVTVTLLDGLVYSRTALNHSANYRSVVCFGTGEAITDAAEKEAVLAAMTSRYFAGRTAGEHYAPPEAKHLTAMALVRVHITEWSAKARRGGPLGPGDDATEGPYTAGVVEV
jgi:nitroimidazol reductase NimA-like FMN-containing flavoprotein (pyridoxamine 5'-phosphate oxidase superfamily)